MKRTLMLMAAALLGLCATAQDAEYKLIRQEWTVLADGSVDYHYRHEVRILRNRALTAYADKGETFVTYNPAIEQLTLNEVYTLRADGSRVEMRDNAFINQLPAECADCGRFNHMVELAMVHTGMELGCTVVVDYTLHSSYPVVNQRLVLAKDCPVARYEVNVSLPEGQELHAQLTEPDLVGGPTVSMQQEARSLRLVATQVPQRSREPYLPAEHHLYPTLHFFNGVPQHTPAFGREGLAEAASMAWRLAADAKPLQAAEAVRDYVVRAVRLNDIDPARLAYTHATAAEVWRSQCGTAIDKAVLLAAMLNTLGLDACVADDNPEAVMLSVDSVRYALSARTTGPIADPYGKALDATDTLRTKQTLSEADYRLDTLADGFFRLELPALGADYPLLGSSRQMPVGLRPCLAESDITFTLPKGMKAIVGKEAASREVSAEGIGTMRISMKQSGRKLRVQRTLRLEAETVPAARAGELRSLLAPLQATTHVLLQSK